MSFRIVMNRLRRRSLMRVEKKGMAVVAGFLLSAIGIWQLSTVVRRTPPQSSAGSRLVSIQEVPDAGEICLPAEHNAADSDLFASFDDNSKNDVLALLRG